jgi:hypothetical protein
MSTMPEPFKTVQDAIIDSLEDQGIGGVDYMPVTLSKVPGSYLSVTDVEVVNAGHADQGELRVGMIRYELNYYVRFDGEPRIATVNALTGVDSIIAACESATLGGRVRDCKIDRISVDPVQMANDQRKMLLVQATLLVRPAPYARAA